MSNREFFKDRSRQMFVYFTVPGNGLCHSGCGILTPVVFPSMPNEYASGGFDSLD
jgi:hypothetical protein